MRVYVVIYDYFFALCSMNYDSIFILSFIFILTFTLCALEDMEFSTIGLKD
jgi:hypothetical protein